MRILNSALAVVFLVFAWFQRNDIDPEIYYKPSGIDATLWFVFYLVIGVLFGFAAAGRKIWGWLLGVMVVACLVEMARSGPGLWQNIFGDEEFTMTQVKMSAEDPRVELSREFFGALIGLAAVVFLWAQRCGCCGKKAEKTTDH